MDARSRAGGRPTPWLTVLPVSPNHDPAPIDVQFLVVHYTAVDLAQTLALFADPAHQAAAHLVIDRDGAVYECVPCLSGPALRAWHAGSSRWSAGGRTWAGLNDLAVGVELVNFNGNVFPYTDAQYAALAHIAGGLRQRYPALRRVDRVLGHEQIAGWRGKVDPGWRFDWSRFCAGAYPGQPTPSRPHSCPPEVRGALALLQEVAPAEGRAANAFWAHVSRLTEALVAAMSAGDGGGA